MKLAIITGASSGIGLATARLFHQNGFQVINVSRSATDDDSIIDITCNLAYESTINDLVDSLEPYIVKASEVCLVHNAGKHCNDSADDCDIDGLKMSLAVNILAPSMLNRGVVHLLPATSSVIYIGSTLSEKATRNSYSYTTSKHAVVGMMKATCQDLANKTIHTACVCPGFTDTEMLKRHIPDEQLRQQKGENNAFARLIKPEEVARLILWAHQNPVINGSVIHANLGQLESC